MGNVTLYRGKAHKIGLILLVPPHMENSSLFHNVQYLMNHCFKNLPSFFFFFFFFFETSSGRINLIRIAWELATKALILKINFE
jgi:hypothetical protein